MRQVAVVIFAVLLFTSCSNPLDKTYTKGTFPADIQFLKDEGINDKNIKIIEYFVKSKQSNLQNKTYGDLLTAGKTKINKEIESLTTKFKKASSDNKLIEMSSAVQEILKLDSENNFAKSEYEKLKSKIQAEISRLEKLYKNQRKTVDKINTCEQILKLDSKNKSATINLAELYTKQRKYDNAKQIIESGKNLNSISGAEYNNLAEKLLIKQNMFKLIELKKGGIQSKSSKDINSNSSVWDIAASKQPYFSVSANQNGYVRNNSKTLTVSVEVIVKFIGKQTSWATILFTVTKNKSLSETKRIKLYNIKPGEAKSFKTGVKLSNYDYGDNGVKQELTNVNVSMRLLSVK